MVRVAMRWCFSQIKRIGSVQERFVLSCPVRTRIKICETIRVEPRSKLGHPKGPGDINALSICTGVVVINSYCSAAEVIVVGIRASAYIARPVSQSVLVWDGTSGRNKIRVLLPDEEPLVLNRVCRCGDRTSIQEPIGQGDVRSDRHHQWGTGRCASGQHRRRATDDRTLSTTYLRTRRTAQKAERSALSRCLSLNRRTNESTSSSLEVHGHRP